MKLELDKGSLAPIIELLVFAHQANRVTVTAPNHVWILRQWLYIYNWVTKNWKLKVCIALLHRRNLVLILAFLVRS